MARCSLLTFPNGSSARKAFAFEHAMAHRNALGVTAPLSRFSVVPYFIEPMVGPLDPAKKWNLNHQQAHNDALQNFPKRFGAHALGMSIGANLIDYDLNNQRQRTWWTFQNHQEHFIASQSILPGTVQPLPPAPQWKYPFW